MFSFAACSTSSTDGAGPDTAIDGQSNGDGTGGDLGGGQASNPATTPFLSFDDGQGPYDSEAAIPFPASFGP